MYVKSQNNIIYKQKGSELTNHFPCVMTDMFFEPGLSMKALIRAIHNPEERAKWDKDVEITENMELVSSNKALLFYQRMKSPI